VRLFQGPQAIFPADDRIYGSGMKECPVIPSKRHLLVQEGSGHRCLQEITKTPAVIYFRYRWFESKTCAKSGFSISCIGPLHDRIPSDRFFSPWVLVFIGWPVVRDSNHAIEIPEVFDCISEMVSISGCNRQLPNLEKLKLILREGLEAHSGG